MQTYLNAIKASPDQPLALQVRKLKGHPDYPIEPFPGAFETV